MGPGDFYTTKIAERFGYLANWLPNSPINLGDVGIMEGRYFKQLSSLAQLQLSFVPRVPQKSANFSYSWEADIASDSSVGANIPGMGAAAGLNVKFNNAGAFVFEITDCTITDIEDKLSLGHEIKKLFEAKKWEPEWVVIDTIVAAGSSTILVSTTNNSEIQLSASGDVSKINLTDVSAGLKIKYQTGEITRILADKGLFPMFKTSKIKWSFLNRMTRNRGGARYGGHVEERVVRDYTEKEIWEPILKSE